MFYSTERKEKNVPKHHPYVLVTGNTGEIYEMQRNMLTEWHLKIYSLELLR